MTAPTTWDYVIVGAGSAGCVLAARLSEDRDIRVLLLEAGGPDDADEVRMPAAFYRLFRSGYDWNYDTVAQPEAASRRIFWPRGKMLGGCSSLNAMLYIRGHRRDYDAWAAAGCLGWSYAELLPYFKRAEDNARFVDDEVHGVGGPLRVEDQQRPHAISHDLLAATLEAGIPASADLNAPEPEGAAFFQVTQKAGRRWSAADAYLRPVLRRPNLTVHTDALVRRLIITGARAGGVEYDHAGTTTRVRAEREVLLCAGAINSPQLLQLSGIGPAADLRALGLDVVVDSPQVGRGLQDHPLAPAAWLTRGTPDLFASETLWRQAQWLTRRRGPLTSPVAEVCAFVRSESSLTAPDLQLHMVPAIIAEHGTRPSPGPGLTIMSVLVDVASRGQVRLASGDPRHKPVIDPGYLTEPTDLQRIVEGLRLAREIAAQPALAAHRRAEYTPGATARTAAELRDAARRTLQTLYHPTSTCAMGPGSDAVVDPTLRVNGVRGLRVVDASVFPAVPRGNTNAPTIAVAERAADLIKEAS